MDTISTDVALHASTSERESHNMIKSNSTDVTKILLHNITQRKHLQQLRSLAASVKGWQLNSRVTSFTDSFLLSNESFIKRFMSD